MIKEIFEFIGMVTVVILGMFILIMLADAIKYGITKLKWRYKYKHRFDKPPTAKCYCRDCKHHGSETGRCYRFGETTKEYRLVADDWFCWEAEPREKEV